MPCSACDIKLKREPKCRVLKVGAQKVIREQTPGVKTGKLDGDTSITTPPIGQDTIVSWPGSSLQEKYSKS